MVFTWIIILISIIGIIVQDFKQRMVYVFWFPVLILSFSIIRLLMGSPYQTLWTSVGSNLLFLIVQFVLVSIYFSIKEGKLVNITKNLLGLGDAFFLVSIAFYLSFLNFFLFYILSLMCTIITWTLWLHFTRKKEIRIPLAGLQALFFILCVFGDWSITSVYLTSDNWLYNFLP